MSTKPEKSEEEQPKSFAERLRQLRRTRDLTQAALARKVGLHYTQIGRYERDQSQPTIAALRKLAQALGVSVDYFAEGELDENGEPKGLLGSLPPFQDVELFEQFRQADELSAEDRDLIKRFLGAFLVKRKIQELTAG